MATPGRGARMLPVDIPSRAQMAKSLGSQVIDHSLHIRVSTSKFGHMRSTRQTTKSERTTTRSIQAPYALDIRIYQVLCIELQGVVIATCATTFATRPRRNILLSSLKATPHSSPRRHSRSQSPSLRHLLLASSNTVQTASPQPLP